MASPSAQSHVSAQRPGPRASSVESRALASIRPMAMASTSPATPTATVMPTTVSTQEGALSKSKYAIMLYIQITLHKLL